MRKVEGNIKTKLNEYIVCTYYRVLVSLLILFGAGHSIGDKTTNIALKEKPVRLSVVYGRIR